MAVNLLRGGWAGLVAVAMSLLCGAAAGQTVTWTGGGDGQSWGQAANWSPATVPTAVNDVVIPAGAGTVRVSGITATAATVNSARSISVESNGVLQGGTWTLTGTARLLADTNCSNRLVNLTLNGSVTPSTGTIRFRWNNVTLNGSVAPTGSASVNVAFEGNQTLSGTWDNTGTTGTLVLEMQAAGTLTIPSGVSVTGGNVSFGGVCFGNAMTLINNGTLGVSGSSRTLALGSQVTTFTNNGTVTVASGNTFTTSAGTFTNAAGGSINVNGGTLTLDGTWSNAGTLTATNATVNLGGTFNPTNLGTFNRTGGTVNVTGTANLGGGTLTLNASAGDWTLSNGTITNGTVSLTGATLRFDASCTNRLSNVTLNGTIAPSTGTNRFRWSNVTLNGSVAPTGSASVNVAFEGNQTLSGTWDNTGTTGTLVLEMQAAGTLTIPSGVSVTGGNVSFGGVCFGNAMTLINNGTLGVSGSSRTLTLGTQVTTFTNNGTITVASGNTFTTSAGTFTNAAGGSITVNGGTLTLDGTWSNAGTLTTTNTTVNLNGTFNPTSLGTFNRTAGIVNVNGTANLGGGTLTLNASTGDWTLSGGALTNGTLNLSGATLLSDTSCSNRLVNLTLNGSVTPSTGTIRFRWNNVTLNGSVAPTGSASVNVAFEGNQTLSGTWDNTGTTGTLVLEMQAAGTLTIPSGVSVTGGNVSFGGVCFGNAMTLINNGTLRSNVANRSVTLGSPVVAFTNNGTLSNANAGGFSINSSTPWTNNAPVSLTGGTHTLGPITNTAAVTFTNATVTFNGLVTNSGAGSLAINGTTANFAGPQTLASFAAVTRTGGTVNIESSIDLAGGTLNLNAATGDWVLNGGSILNGTINQSGAVLAFSSSCSNRLSNITFNGNIAPSTGTSRIRWNNVTLNGSVAPTGNASVNVGFEGNQTLSGTWDTSASTGTLVFEMQTAGTLTIPSGVSVTGGNISFGSVCFGNNMTLINNGTLRSNVANRNVTLGSPVIAFTNNGTLSNANAGGFSINSTTPWTNNAPVSLTGGTHTLGAITNTAAVTFTNATVTFNGLVTNSGAGSLAINGTAATFSGPQTLASFAAVSRTGGTVSIETSIDLAGGTLNLNTTTGDWVLNGGSILNGTINQNGGLLVFSSSCGNRLSNITFNGNIAPSAGTSRIFWNNVTLNGSVAPTGSASVSVAFQGNQTLSGTWDTSASTGTMVLEMQTAGTLTIPSGVSVTGGNISFGSVCFGNNMTLINNGTLRSNVANRSVTFSSPVVSITNNGTLSNANGGSFSTSSTTTTWTNNQPITLTGGTHDFANLTNSQPVSVSTGTLAIRNLTNTGTIAVSGGTLNLSGTVGNTGSGTLTATNTNTTFSGPITLASFAGFSRTGGTVNIASTLDLASAALTLNATTGDWTLTGGGIINGTLNLSGAALRFDSSCSNRLSNITFNGNIAPNSGISRIFWNNVTLNGSVSPTGSASINVAFQGNQTFSGTWDTSASSGTLVFEMQTAGTVTIPVGVSVSGGSISFGSVCFGLNMNLVNNGELSTSGPGRTLTFASNVTYANLNAATGTLTAGGLTARNGARISMPGNVQIRNIAAGASLRLGSGNSGIVSSATSLSVIDLINTVDGVFELLEARDFTLAPLGGTLTNNGQIAVSAGSTLSVNGNYVQTAQGALVSGISGTAVANVGNINVSGTASIAGALTAQYTNGYIQVGCTGSYRVLFANGGLTGTFGSTNLPVKDEPYVAGMNYFGQAANFVSAPRSDIVSIGGFPPGDGLLTGDDFVAFVNAFAAGDLLADVCGIGGPPEPRDGLLTGDDFIAFINSFAAACP